MNCTTTVWTELTTGEKYTWKGVAEGMDRHAHDLEQKLDLAQADMEAQRKIAAETVAMNAILCNGWKALAQLLTEARDTVQASIAEDGISDDRRAYRAGLYQRLVLAAKEAQ